MTEKRRPSTRLRGSDAAAPISPQRPTPQKAAPQRPTPQRPISSTSTPSTPAHVQPSSLVLPSKVQENRPLPTTLKPQQVANLPLAEYQSVTESGVLAASLRKSKEVWLSNGIFQRYWTKPSKKKGGAAAAAAAAAAASAGAASATEAPAANPPKERMVRLGACTLIAEPHMFEISLFGVRTAPQASAAPAIITTTTATTAAAPITAPPVTAAAQPGPVLPQPLPSIRHATPALSIPPGRPTGVLSSQPAPFLGASAPPYLSHSRPNQAPLVVPRAPSTGSQSPLPLQPPGAVLPPPLPSPIPRQQQLLQQQQQQQPPPPLASVPPYSTAISASPRSHAPIPNPPTVTANRPVGGSSSSGGGGVGVAAANAPRRQTGTSTDPVIRMLAAKSTMDPKLKELMETVASGQASASELEIFQRHIDHLTALFRAATRETTTKMTTTTTATTAPAVSAPLTLPPPSPASGSVLTPMLPPLSQAPQLPRTGPGPGPGVQFAPPQRYAGGSPALPVNVTRPLAPAPVPAATTAASPAATPATTSSAVVASPTAAPTTSVHIPAASPLVLNQRSMGSSSVGSISSGGGGGTPATALPPISHVNSGDHRLPPATVPKGFLPLLAPPLSAQPPPSSLPRNTTTIAAAVPPPPPLIYPTTTVSHAPTISAPITATAASTATASPTPASTTLLTASAAPELSAVVFEFAAAPGDRYLFPKHSILDYTPDGTQVLASFLVVRDGSKSDHCGGGSGGSGGVATTAAATAAGGSAGVTAGGGGGGGGGGGQPAYDPHVQYYEPVTVRLVAAAAKTLEPLARVVAPPADVQRHMNAVMDRARRAPRVHLVLRLPRDAGSGGGGSGSSSAGGGTGAGGAGGAGSAAAVAAAATSGTGLMAGAAGVGRGSGSGSATAGAAGPATASSSTTTGIATATAAPGDVGTEGAADALRSAYFTPPGALPPLHGR